MNRVGKTVRGVAAAGMLLTIAFIMLMPFKVAFADTPAIPAGDPCAASKGDCYTPLTTIPGAFKAGTPTNPISVITNIYGVSIGVAAVLAIAMITWAGVEYATTEAIDGKSGAKARWTGAIYGLLLLLGSYVILRTININLVNFDLSNLVRPCGTNAAAGQNGIACGSTVSKNILQAIAASANKAAANYLSANQKVAEAQKSADSLQSQLDALQTKIQNTDRTSPEYAKLFDQFDTLQKQHDDAVAVLASAKINAASAGVTAAADQGTLQIASSIQNGDFAGAENKTTAVIDTMNQRIADLSKLNASQNVIDSAVAKVNITKITSDQNIKIAQYIQDISARAAKLNNVASNQSSLLAVILDPMTGVANIAKFGNALLTTTNMNDPQIQQNTLDLRNTLYKTSSDAVTSLKTLDPAQAESFRQQALANIDQLDKSVSDALGCKNGYDPRTIPFTCKN